MIEEQKANEIYSLIRDGGNITISDIKNFIETVFPSVNDQQTSQILQTLGNVVTRSEFRSILELLVRKKATNLEVFHSWDRERKGFVDRAGIKAMLKDYGLSFKESYIDSMMRVFEGEKIDFERFDKFLNDVSGSTTSTE